MLKTVLETLVLAVALAAFAWAAAERLPPPPASGGRWTVEDRADGLIFEVERERVLPARDYRGSVQTSDRERSDGERPGPAIDVGADTDTVELTVVVPGAGRRVLRLVTTPTGAEHPSSR